MFNGHFLVLCPDGFRFNGLSPKLCRCELRLVQTGPNINKAIALHDVSKPCLLLDAFERMGRAHLACYD